MMKKSVLQRKAGFFNGLFFNKENILHWSTCSCFIMVRIYSCC